jgi:hypothetical protein
MADQRPILPLTAGIGSVTPTGIDSGERAFMNRPEPVMDFLSGIGNFIKGSGEVARPTGDDDFSFLLGPKGRKLFYDSSLTPVTTGFGPPSYDFEEADYLETIQKKMPRGIVSDTTDIETTSDPYAISGKIGQGIDVTDVDVSDITARVFPEAEAVRAAEVSGIGAQPDITTDVEIADDSKAGKKQPTQRENILGNYENLMKQSLDSYQEALDRAPSGAKSMDEYKKEFSEATGIDISGDPDNKAALMAFGLALMQNKAGKGFDVGKMLSSVGEAGEKALPVMEKAREEARAAKLAAGKYALDKGSEADKLRQSYLIDQSNYLTKRKAQINDMAVARLEAIEDRDLKIDAAENLAHINGKYDAAIAELEARMNYNKALIEGQEVKISNTWTHDNIVKGQPKLGIRKGIDQNGNTVILDGAGTARQFADAYGNLIQAELTIDELESIIRDIGENTGSPAGDILLGRAEEVARGLGFELNLSKDITIDNRDGTEEVVKGISGEAQASALIDRLLAEYKRFLSQETGNGISEGDFQRLSKLVGEIRTLTNPKEKLARLDQLRKMFATPKKQIQNIITDLSDVSMYANESEANKAIAIFNDAAAFNTAALGIDITQGEDGLLIYNLTE